MNSTMDQSAILNMNEYYIACSISFGFGLFSVIISMIIVIIITRSRSQLHTVRHLLISNTCIASIVYCTTQSANYIVLIFFPSITDDIACRWRGYFSYISIATATYSYLIQTISRLFFSVFASRYPWLTTFDAHRILICFQWFIAFTVPLSAIITKDIYFRPGHLCWVPMKSYVHLVYTFVGCYAGPVLAVLIIYTYIYIHIQKTTKQTKYTRNLSSQKRDLKVLRNILVLLNIYISGGIPILLFLLTNIQFLYLFGIVTFTMAVLIEKLFTIGLDRELRSTVRNMISSRNRVMPFDNNITQFGTQQNETPV